jgi:transaldolase
MKKFSDLKIKIFADGADIEEMKKAKQEGIVKGFTTNPTLMKKSGVNNYGVFAAAVLKEIKDLPISFEVFADDFSLMEQEARKIFGWGGNVNVKIPITDTAGRSSLALVEKLSHEGLSLNVTAILSLEQIKAVAKVISPAAKTIVSVFAGRIADTGRNPVPIMQAAAALLRPNAKAELLWASSRELLNIFQADECGCQIITVTPDILKKLRMIGQDLTELSLDTVKMFHNDARALGYSIL